MADDKKKKAVKTIRLPAPEGERIDELADERDMTEADMYRHLIRTGLDAETDDEGDEPELTARRFDSVLSLQRLWALSVTLALLVLIVGEVGAL
jgi:hypothetical protein